MWDVKEMRQASYTVQMQAGEYTIATIVEMQLSSAQVISIF